MNLLHLLSTVDPRAGGPIEGVRQSGSVMASMGHRIEVATLDAPDAPFLNDFPLPLTALGPGRGFYGFSPRFVPWLREHAARFDAVVVHGLWQFHGFGAWQALRAAQTPYYVYAHGMLDPWFKRAYPLKHLKKWLYWPWAEYRVLRDAAAVIFTTEDERLLARQSFWLYRANERVVPFGTGLPPPDAPALREAFWQAWPELRGKRLVLFLGRIHPKKGCDLLIRAFAEYSRDVPDAHLMIAGPDLTGWQPSLQTIATSCAIADRITWPGMLQGDLKWGAFYASDVFALPSHQENFGVAVAEALACGLPVLISDKVNIWREVAEDHAGFVGEDSVAGATYALSRWRSLDDSARETMRLQAARTFATRFTNESMVAALLAVLESRTADTADAADTTAAPATHDAGAASVKQTASPQS